VVRAADGRVLVAERAAWRHAGGGLEFPGGKIEPGESAGDALARELAEELGIAVEHTRTLIRVRHAYPDRLVELHVLTVEGWHGRAAGLEGQALHWLVPGELRQDDFPAANAPIIAALAWPAVLRVTPVGIPVAGAGERVAAAARAGDWVQLRRPDLQPEAWRRLVEDVRARVDDIAAGRILLNTTADDPLLAGTGFGLHLNAARAGERTARPAGPARFSCSAHDEAELAAAERLGADFVVVGPVGATPSHPGAAGLGWPGLAALTAAKAIPVYAIGGLAPGDVERARDHGAVGVAGISGFW